LTINAELEKIVLNLLDVIRKILANHTQLQPKYKILEQQCNDMPMPGLTLEKLKKSLEAIYLLHRELKDIMVSVLLSIPTSNM
jgi:hypothetical protein